MYDIEKYYNAGTVSEAVTLLNEHPDTRIISGGSDVLIKIREGRMAGTSLVSIRDIEELKAGDYVYLTGTIYTARDAAHKRMYDSMKKGESLPIELKGNVLYYLGPSPAREGQVIGSAGPTTSSRMDKYTPDMLDDGLKGMVGKGKRSPEVIEAMKRNHAVYFAAVGGAGALLSQCIKEAEVVAYDDLGTEAIRRLYIENLPVIVVIDKDGNNLYETASKKWQKI